MFFIDGKKMPSPSGLSVSYADRGDFSRFNVLGERVADRTATKRTIEANWAMLSDAEMKALIEAVSGGIFFVVKYAITLMVSFRVRRGRVRKGRRIDG